MKGVKLLPISAFACSLYELCGTCSIISKVVCSHLWYSIMCCVVRLV